MKHMKQIETEELNDDGDKIIVRKKILNVQIGKTFYIDVLTLLNGYIN